MYGKIAMGEVVIIAGHLFNSLDQCACGRRWVDLLHVDLSCVGLEGYAHVGALNVPEVNQILVEKARRQKLFGDAQSESTSW